MAHVCRTAALAYRMQSKQSTGQGMRTVDGGEIHSPRTARGSKSVQDKEYDDHVREVLLEVLGKVQGKVIDSLDDIHELNELELAAAVDKRDTSVPVQEKKYLGQKMGSVYKMITHSLYHKKHDLPKDDLKSKMSQIEEWKCISFIAALLVGVAAMGLFETAQYIGGGGNGETSPVSSDARAKSVMIIFCIDTFCFLNSTILSTFFISYEGRNSHLTLQQLREKIGYAFSFPVIYFRIGFVLLVLALSGFFVMVMEAQVMAGCLSFCIATIIAPMVWGLWMTLGTLLVRQDQFSPSGTNASCRRTCGQQ